MNIHDPKFTVRLEPALKWLVNYPNASLAVVGNKYDVEPGDLGAWLREFNHGTTTGLMDARIAEVKGETGAMTVRKAARVPRSDIGHAHTGASKMTPPDVLRTRPAGGHRHDSARFIPVLREMLTSMLPYKEVAGKHGISAGAWSGFKFRHFGAGPLDPAKVEAFARKHGEEKGVATVETADIASPIKDRVPRRLSKAAARVTVDSLPETPSIIAPVIVPVTLRIRVELAAIVKGEMA
jgi:hypothetical protein